MFLSDRKMTIKGKFYGPYKENADYKMSQQLR